MVTLALSDADKRRIEAAVADVETRSSAEILVVTAHRAGDYGEAAAFGAAGAALFGGALAALVSPLSAAAVVAGQMALFAVAWIVFTYGRAGHWLVPRPLRIRRARHAAALEFAQLVNAQTADKRGLLIYLSFAERHIEIVADRGIATLVPDARWQEIVDAFPALLADRPFGAALSDVVERCGAILTESFPAEPGQRNEIADRIVER